MSERALSDGAGTATATLALDIRVQHPAFTLELCEELPLAGVTAVFGPSGGGKTTLLRAIAGLTPCVGRIALGARVLCDTAQRCRVPTHRREIAVTFQDGRLFPHRDVAGNLRYAWRRTPTALREDAFWDEVVDAFGLAPLFTRSVQELSGGERQRVALARTLLSRPRLLLLDEPLSALDARRRGEILPYLEAMNRRFDLPVLYVTHAIDEVARLADRVLVLVDGRCQAMGATANILERLDLEPITGRFEAGVVLAARTGRWDPRWGLLELEAAGGLRLVVPTADPPASDTAVRVRVLARDVALARERPSAISVRNLLAAQVLSVTPLHDASPFVDVLLSTGGQRLRSRITRASAAELALAAGVPVHALIKSVSLERA